MEFKAWGKTPRLSNERYYVTEKLDGTNSCIVIDGTDFACQSRNRFITPEDDNFGFARWAYANKEELMKLGDGYHYGEWWGQGVGRTYDMEEKRFSLFDTNRWNPENPNLPSCCHVVPYLGECSPEDLPNVLSVLKEYGSRAAPGFMRVEGVIIWSKMTKSRYKVILDK